MEFDKETIVFVCSAKGSYTRNDVLRGVLRKIAGRYREVVSEKETYFERLLEVLRRWLILPKNNASLVLGFVAQALVPMAIVLGWRIAIMDVFISVFDTLCLDRKTFKADGCIGGMIKAYERWCLNKADILLTDTEENADYYAEIFGISRRRFVAVPVSANADLFRPPSRQPGERSTDGKIRVLYYCTFLPLHGAGVVYQAARLLSTDNHIEWVIVGKGPLSGRLDAELGRWGLPNVRRIPWVPYENLGLTVAEADICLAGHFSKNPKALRVVPGKAYQYLAAAKPVVLGDAPANRRHFTHNQNAVFCDPESADDLARTIWHLAADAKLREKIGRNGFLLFQDQFCADVLAQKLSETLRDNA